MVSGGYVHCKNVSGKGGKRVSFDGAIAIVSQAEMASDCLPAELSIAFSASAMASETELYTLTLPSASVSAVRYNRRSPISFAKR